MPRALTHTMITLGLLTIGATSPRCHTGVPLVPMVFWASFLERCATRLVRAMQRMQFRAKSAKNDLKPTDFLKHNFYFETEGVCNN